MVANGYPQSGLFEPGYPAPVGGIYFCTQCFAERAHPKGTPLFIWSHASAHPIGAFLALRIAEQKP